MAATAMATMVQSAVKSLAANLKLRAPRDIHIEGDDWHVLVQGLGDGFVTLYLLDEGVNVGLLGIHSERWRPDLQDLIEELQRKS